MSELLLDISRSVSRADASHPTGIDRVERAYIDRFLNGPQPCRFLAKVPGGTFVIDAEATRKIVALLHGPDAKFPMDFRARLSFGRSSRLKSLESAVRQLGSRLESWNSKRLPTGLTYFNVGHSNLTQQTVAKLRQLGVERLVAMLHDTIPLDYPQYSSAASTAGFPGKLRAMARFDLLLCNSRQTEKQAKFWLQNLGLAATTQVAPLGIHPAPEFKRDPARPRRFLMLGTIEPRKNHALMLDVWQQFHASLPAESIPHLDVVGGRGWKNADLFRRLDAAIAAGWHVHELGPLPDDEIPPLMARATALLFPSLAEGFGLPVLEALAARLPVICSDLPVLHELAGDAALYLPAQDAHSWARAIIGPQEPNAQNGHPMEIPTWDRHFDGVFGHVRAMPGVSGPG